MATVWTDAQPPLRADADELTRRIPHELNTIS